MKLQNLSHLRINVLFVNFVNTYEQCQQDKIYVLEGAINDFWGFDATGFFYSGTPADIYSFFVVRKILGININIFLS